MSTLTRGALTLLMIMLVVIGGDVATSPRAFASPGDPSPTECREQGNHLCGIGPFGPRADRSCPAGGVPDVGGLGRAVCRYGD